TTCHVHHCVDPRSRNLTHRRSDRAEYSPAVGYFCKVGGQLCRPLRVAGLHAQQLEASVLGYPLLRERLKSFAVQERPAASYRVEHLACTKVPDEGDRQVRHRWPVSHCDGHRTVRKATLGIERAVDWI